MPVRTERLMAQNMHARAIVYFALSRCHILFTVGVGDTTTVADIGYPCLANAGQNDGSNSATLA